MVKKVIAFILLSSFVGTQVAQAKDSRPDFKVERLSGNWKGQRDSLYESGISLDMSYSLGLWSNMSGGLERDTKWNGNLDIVVGLDGEKIYGIPGLSAEVYFLGNNGLRPNDMVGSAGGLDNTEVAEGQFKLYTAWLQQNFADDVVSVKVGLYDLNSEFYVTDVSGLFLNPTYGIGTEMAATGDNGPSVFPNAGLAARIAVQPTKNIYLQAAILDGVPNDPNNQDSTQIEFDDKQGALVVAEAGVRHDDYGHYGIGLWTYTADRPDQLTAIPADSRGLYFLAEKNVYAADDRSVDLFARLGFTQGDVEQFDNAWAAGAVLTGFVPRRDEGQLGFGISRAENGSRYKAANVPSDDAETQFEITYVDMILPWLSIQPDLQYTVNPGTASGVDNALTAGIRFGIDF